MKYIAAYHLLAIGGNDAPSAADIIALLSTVGIEAESERVETVVARLAGRDIDELISEGTSKLASVPSDDAVVADAHIPAGAPAEEKMEPKECDDCGDNDLMFNIFD